MDYYVLDTSFWDVIAWMIIGFFLVLVIMMFIQVFADIFRRRDLSGWGKAGWAIFVLVLPLLGILFYIAFRPAPTAEELAGMGYPGSSAVDEITRAQQLLNSGVITQAEFDDLKRKALS
ncbi:MAG TPA: PLDc N-terminal domain-containing protein [Dehalococcoidia bacterium]|nr:PLDc N-terminal domain-containing protein [Dehalococcoidia bacterium]